MNTTSSNIKKTERSFRGGLNSWRLRATRCLSGRSIIIVACLMIIAGYFLMSGSGSTEQTYNPEIFSPRRIVFAPTLCLSGYLLIIIGILRMGR